MLHPWTPIVKYGAFWSVIAILNNQTRSYHYKVLLLGHDINGCPTSSSKLPIMVTRPVLYRIHAHAPSCAASAFVLGSHHTRLTIATLRVQRRWCTAHPIFILANSRARLPRHTLGPSQLVLPAPHGIFWRRFSDCGGNFCVSWRFDWLFLPSMCHVEEPLNASNRRPPR